MILAFGFRNFFSFREDVEISFRLDSKAPESVSKGRDFSRVIGIKGANGSGKTQILKALSFLGSFCTDSFNAAVDASVGTAAFFDSPEPSFLFIEFRIKSVEYRYELLCTNSAVVSETIFRSAKKKTKILERVGNTITHRIAALKGLDEVKLRKNVSIISTAHQYELPHLESIYDFFDFFESNVSFVGFHHTPREIDFVAEFLAETADSKILPFIIDFIRDCDTGVSDIQIRSFTDQNGAKKYFPVFFHKVNEVNKPISAFAESSGTKSLFQILTSYYLSRVIGSVLIVDEFDINLHPHILPKLIALFDDDDKNPHDAQLIFTTHDSEVLEILGRYRTYLVAKEENESYAYRLDEIPGDLLRNDRPLRPVYMSGRIGGVPRDVESEQD